MRNTLGDLYWKNVTPPAAIIDNASATTAEVDTVVNGVKFNTVTFIVDLGALDIAVSALKVQGGDTSGSLADITATVFGGTGNPALPSATADNGIYKITLVAHYRYYDLVLTLGDGAAGTYVAVLAILSDGSESPATATERGLAADVYVQ